MPKWIAFFRGINVGGKNPLPMRLLVNELESIKLKNIRTYIQSGNVVFDSAVRNRVALSQAISERILSTQGFSPQVVIIDRVELQEYIRANPYPSAANDPKSLHYYFLECLPPTPNFAALDRAKSATEEYRLIGSLFVLHAPDGVGRSKLAASAEKHLGVAATARNYRTVVKVAALADEE
jgi:uncharacterized protein (DUF1697 family)